MKIQNICLLLVIIFTTFACKQQKTKNQSEELLKEITSLEEKTYSQKEELNFNLAKELLSKYIEYADLYTNDSLSPEFLLKASSLASGIGNPRQSINCLERIENNYPNFNKIANVVFLHAFVLDTEIKDKSTAKEYYEKFIEEYPTHALVEDAKNAISLTNFNEKELIQFLESKNQ